MKFRMILTSMKVHLRRNIHQFLGDLFRPFGYVQRTVQTGYCRLRYIKQRLRRRHGVLSVLTGAFDPAAYSVNIVIFLSLLLTDIDVVLAPIR